MKEIEQRDPAAKRWELKLHADQLLAAARAEFTQAVVRSVNEALTALQVKERRISMEVRLALWKLDGLEDGEVAEIVVEATKLISQIEAKKKSKLDRAAEGKERRLKETIH